MTSPALDRRKLTAGAIFIAFGAIGLFMAMHMDLGAATQMGPGSFPLLLAGALTALGLLHVAMALRATRPVPLEGWRGKSVLLVPLSVVAFGVTVDRWGLIPAIFLSGLLGALANPTLRPHEVIAICVALSLLGSALFVYVLGLPITLIVGL